eukprot:4815906-Amphidinium_carterae.1
MSECFASPNGKLMESASRAKHVYVPQAPECGITAISLSMDALLVRVLEGVSLAIPSLLVARQGCLSQRISDIMDVKLLDYLGAPCVEIGGARCHGFAASPTDQEFVQLARSLHARLGLPRPRNVELVGHVCGAEASGKAAARASSDRSVRFSVGHPGQCGVTWTRCLRQDVAYVAGDDMRMMPLKCDSHGERRSLAGAFLESVALLNAGVADLDKMIAGHRSFLWLAKHAQDNGKSFFSNHHVEGTWP